MSEAWPVLTTLGTEEEARMLVGYLEGRGVECEIESLRFHQEPVNFGHLGEVRVRVPAEQEVQAREALSELREGGPVLAEDEAVEVDEPGAGEEG